MATRITVNLLDSDKTGLINLACLEGESVAVTVRRIIRRAIRATPARPTRKRRNGRKGGPGNPPGAPAGNSPELNTERHV